MKKQKLLEMIKNEYDLDEKTAAGLILSGKVLVDEVPVTKTGFNIKPDQKIRIKKVEKYVSRGAYKLLCAFENFNVTASGKICIDVGSSTGGFTQVLLEKGAALVYSVDCGYNLLDYSLRKNSKVTVKENSRILDLQPIDFEKKIDLAVMDISFSSAVKIINHLFFKLNISELIVLVKPQFEYNRLIKKLNLKNDFNGIVYASDEREKIINFLIKEIEDLNLKVYDTAQSSIKGSKGNVEYLFHVKKKS